MITIKEYAKQKKVSYEAIRKQISRYRKELGDNLVKQGRTQYLTKEGQDFLDKKRKENPVIIMESSKEIELEELRREKGLLLLKIAELQDQLLKEKDLVKELQEEKILLLEQKNKSFFEKIFGKKK